MSGTTTVRCALTLSPRRLRQLWYAPLLVVAMGLMMLRMLVMARLFDVPVFAEFSGGILVSSTFCMLGCLGLQAMLQREWPVNLVRRQELRGLVRAAQCNIVALACCSLGLLVAACGVTLAGIPPALLAIGLLHGLSQQYFLVATVESRSRGDALRFAQQNLLRAVVALGLSVAVALWTGSALAALAIDALATVVMALGFFRRSIGQAKFGAAMLYALALRRLRRVPWGSALTLMVIMVVGFGLLNADRWVASDRLGAAGFAHYSFAWIVLSMAQSAQVVINASVYPLLARRFAAQGQRMAFSVCLRASVAILVVGAVVAVPSGYVLAYGIRRWYPHFADVTTLLPLFLAVAVLRVSDFWSSFLLITGFEGRLLRLNLAAAAIGLLVWACFVRPWVGGPLMLAQVGGLAALLTLGAYAATATASWRARHA
jgi:O-antigen/teichoic acid export membrane protein